MSLFIPVQGNSSSVTTAILVQKQFMPVNKHTHTHSQVHDMQQSAVLTLTEHFGLFTASSSFFKPIARIFKDIPALQNRHTQSAGQAQSHCCPPTSIQDWPEDSRRWWAGRRAEDSDLWAFYRCRCLTPCRWYHSIGPSETQSIMLTFMLQCLILEVCLSVNGVQYLMQHLHTVLVEAQVVVGFSGSPVCERDLVMIWPWEQTWEAQIIQTDPHVPGGCFTEQRRKSSHTHSHVYLGMYWVWFAQR